MGVSGIKRSERRLRVAGSCVEREGELQGWRYRADSGLDGRTGCTAGLPRCSPRSSLAALLQQLLLLCVGDELASMVEIRGLPPLLSGSAQIGSVPGLG